MQDGRPPIVEYYPGNAPFRCNGIASLSDLATPLWRETYEHLEKIQAEFLEKQSLFRSPEYRWPHDALRCRSCRFIWRWREWSW